MDINGNLYKEDPFQFEDWEDILLWRQSADKIFQQAIQQYFKSLIIKVSHEYLIECINNKNLSEISLIQDLYRRESFIDKEYEICALFVDNKEEERFFILKKNDDYYALDISKQYKYLCKY